MSEKNALSLQELQQVELSMLVHLREYCTAHDISYMLSNGTLLGAVKYKGFIPWDDDIDVFIPRKDYDRLIRDYEDSSRYVLFSPERVAGYGFPFAKLCDMTTRREEFNNDNGVELGVDIDIFPLDVWCECAQKQVKAQARRMTFLRLAKNRTITARTFLKRVVKKATAVVCKVIGAAFFIKRLQCGAVNSSPDAAYMGCTLWPVYGAREIVPAEAFAQTIEVEFEGERFNAPKGYDVYLRSLYGDYEQDPPPEKQKTHHRFTAYWA